MTTKDQVKTIQEYFERLYQQGITPWVEHGLEPAITDLADRIVREVPAPRLLDIGCGNGWLSIHFAKRGIQVEAIDSSPTAIAEAQETSAQAGVADLVHFQIGNGLELPYTSASFDVVFDRGFFHHLLEDDYAQYLTEVPRVLRDRGLLSLHAFTGRNPPGIGHRFEREDITRIFGGRFEVLEQSTDPWPTDAPAHLGHYLLQKR